MTFRRMLPRAGLLAALLMAAGNSASAETIRIGGIGAAMGMLPGLSAAFDPTGQTKVEVIFNLGSSGGLAALGGGALDIAVTGRPLKPEELSQGMVQSVVVQTPFVFVTSHQRPNGIKGSDIAIIYAALKPTWADGTPIRVVMRPKADSDTTVLAAMFPGMPVALEQARQRPELPLAATDQDNLDLTERLDGSLSAATLTQIKTEKRDVRFVTIDGIQPSLENLESRKYPYGKTLAFVLPAIKKPAAERFVEFLRTPAGQAALLEAGVVLMAN